MFTAQNKPSACSDEGEGVDHGVWGLVLQDGSENKLVVLTKVLPVPGVPGGLDTVNTLDQGGLSRVARGENLGTSVGEGTDGLWELGNSLIEGDQVVIHSACFELLHTLDSDDLAVVDQVSSVELTSDIVVKLGHIVKSRTSLLGSIVAIGVSSSDIRLHGLHSTEVERLNGSGNRVKGVLDSGGSDSDHEGDSESSSHS